MQSVGGAESGARDRMAARPSVHGRSRNGHGRRGGGPPYVDMRRTGRDGLGPDAAALWPWGRDRQKGHRPVDAPTTPGDRLAALAAHLAARNMDVELTDRDLLVHHRDTGLVAGLIVCHPRPEDGGALWFFTGSGEPLAPAAHIVDAALAFKALRSQERR